MNKRIVSIATALLIAFSLMPATAQTGTGYDPRAEDQRRIVALEWAVQGQPWPACGER